MEIAGTNPVQQTTIAESKNTKETASEQTDFKGTWLEALASGEPESTESPESAAERLKESYLARHEEEFLEEYPLYEKYKDVFIPKYSNYTREKANKILEELQTHFPDFSEKRNAAMFGGSEEEKAEFHEMQKEYLALNNRLTKKYDMEVGFIMPFVQTPEAVKAYNYAVYEQLEQGVGIDEATDRASRVAQTFGSNEGMVYFGMLFFGGGGNMDDAMARQEREPEEIDYDWQIDLRDYGYEHNFEWHDYGFFFHNDREGVKERIMYDLKLFSFLTQNEEIVERKIFELKQRNPENSKINSEEYTGNLKAHFLESYKTAELAKTVYDKYADKIFGDTPGQSNTDFTGRSETVRYKIDMAVQQTYPVGTATSGLSSVLQTAG